MIDKQDIPRIVPNYNPEAIYDLTKAAKLRAFLSAFHTKLSKGARHLITSDDEQLVLDSGCSIAITPDLTDFVDGTYSIQNYNVNGIGSGLQAIGIGEVELEVLDIKNQPVILKLQCLHVPNAPCRLVPPQQLCRNDDPSKPNLNGTWIGGNSNDAKVIYNGHIISFPYDK